MVDFPNFLDPQAVMNFANTQSWGGWISIGINLILSTIVSGIVLIVLVEVFSHKFGESIKPQNALLVALLGNIINTVLLMFVVGLVPFGVYVIPIAVWFALMKLFFPEMNMLHAFLVAVIFFFLTILLIPTLVGMLSVFIPSF
jgi:hypothetical protein